MPGSCLSSLAWSSYLPIYNVMNSSENKAISVAKPSNLVVVDIMRGVSALGVAWFHSRSDLWIGFKAINADGAAYSVFDRFLSYFSLPVSQMGGMVMLFFVLSGFCIHLPTARRKVAPAWNIYFARRFLRIYPPYVAIILICLLLANTILNSGPGEFKEWDIYGLSVLMIQNWAGNGSQISLNPSLWTIPAEMVLYIFYPVSLFIRGKFKLSVSIAYTLFLAAVSYALFLVGNHQSLASLLSYVVIWNSGAWLAEAYQEGKIPKIANIYCVSLIIALTGLVMLAGFFDVNAYYLTYGWGLIAFLLMIWSIGAGSSMFSLGHWFTRFMVFIGTISYSLYLIHYPLFKLLGHLWIQLFGSKPVSFLIPSLATIIAIPISFFFYVYFEKPSHEISKKLSRPS
jgi:peptidoglycan/LPS O-acetylase OafA/YrhL